MKPSTRPDPSLRVPEGGRTTPAQVSQVQRATFDAIAHHYDRTIPAHIARHYLRKRLQLITTVLPPGSRLLDVGCGTGRLAVHLRDRRFTTVGVDGSHEMLKQLATRRHLDVVQATFDGLPFLRERFEGAVTIATIHHTIDPVLLDRMLWEMVRVLRVGGLLILWDHNPNNPYWRWLMPRLPQDRGGYRLVSLRELLQRLHRIPGLEVIAVHRTGAIPDFVPRWALRGAQRLERWWEHAWGLRWLLAHHVVIARKAGA